MKLSNLFKNFLPEILVFSLFCIGTITISFFHEPWFDEFQSWAIAKDNLYNILFVIPHLEGHPPLWHIIIKFFQQFTDNPELAIKIPNLLAMFGAVWLLLFKSPFPRKVKLALPFTYFIFYQYSIINRPYSLLTLALFIAAIMYKNKNEHPYKFISALAFLALTSAYGMVLSTAITIAWVMEISDKKEISTFLKSFFKDKRFYAMLCLFFVCLAISFILYPHSEALRDTGYKSAPLLLKIIYFYCALPADSLLFNIIGSGKQLYLSNPYFIAACTAGLTITCFLYNFFKKNGHLYIFALPYFSILFFACLIYIAFWHIGILCIVIIFSFWCVWEENNSIKISSYNAFSIMLAIILAIQISWSATSSYNDIKYQYANGREISSYIVNHNLSKYKLFSEWQILNTSCYEKDCKTLYDRENTNVQRIPTSVSAYLRKNIFYNFNVKYPQKLYVIHKFNTPNDNMEDKVLWAKEGYPDIIFGNPQIESVFGSNYKLLGNYIQIKTFDSGFIWKNLYFNQQTPLYVHKKLYEKMKDYE